MNTCLPVLPFLLRSPRGGLAPYGRGTSFDGLRASSNAHGVLVVSACYPFSSFAFGPHTPLYIATLLTTLYTLC